MRLRKTIRIWCTSRTDDYLIVFSWSDPTKKQTHHLLHGCRPSSQFSSSTIEKTSSLIEKAKETISSLA
jgi:hypothetical protein